VYSIFHIQLSCQVGLYQEWLRLWQKRTIILEDQRPNVVLEVSPACTHPPAIDCTCTVHLVLGQIEKVATGGTPAADPSSNLMLYCTICMWCHIGKVSWMDGYSDDDFTPRDISFMEGSICLLPVWSNDVFQAPSSCLIYHRPAWLIFCKLFLTRAELCIDTQPYAIHLACRHANFYSIFSLMLKGTVARDVLPRFFHGSTI
jgi:hypothetical protein